MYILYELCYNDQNSSNTNEHTYVITVTLTYFPMLQLIGHKISLHMSHILAKYGEVNCHVPGYALENM